ncbi:MAG: COX15/CtaA family protein [Chitinophagales bacterium]|nr:COX15/CtaA family protein [Chitinophagales bacterium]
MKDKVVGTWLMIGVLMIFIQVLIGGITRITGSGLSITKWEIVTGTIPPLNSSDWHDAFDLYKETPQYKKINEGMSLKEFKFIYFWEYFHRLWARLMGLVFAIPFIFFLTKKWLRPGDIANLAGVILLAAVVASFGWIMVQSGLYDRPWVSPIKLSLHLILAIFLFIFVLLLSFDKLIPKQSFYNSKQAKPSMLLVLLIFALFIQIILGGMMSGLRAGINYPTFPLMNGSLFPPALYAEFWSVKSLVNFESSTFTIAFVQFFHRVFALFVLVLSLIFSLKMFKLSKSPISKNASLFLTAAVIAQFTIGVITVLKCKSGIPLFWGVMHQAFALVLISALAFNVYLLISEKKLSLGSSDI